ncbi:MULTISPECIES: sensor histidine kinase KdpD [unclassified Flavobacterium]|uniref:sensor histidine kinase n=1 Tax=unclassified Flavobacterium TaxID=196869 RepID=UPI0012909D11|nr:MULTISPECIES: HAMP domain-containing sensor histidine kinase [unclassified Flavobacterium]MQP51465.1 sensor histidine kinase [Flavobacterium sp. LMO9]MQP61307.1 sensor histidine kinase [Flavobacterium sp. LMO6]
MKFNRFNTVIFIGFLAIVGVIIMQLFLLNQAYIFEKKDMEDKIHFALQDVVEKIYFDNKSELPITNPVKKVSENYFIVNVNDVFENRILEQYLKLEFEKVKLELDFEYAIYDCGSDEMVYGNYISIDGKSENFCADCFSKNSNLTYYFAVRFPNLKQTYFKSISQYWIFTGVLFLVLIIYVYSVFLMLQQKRYTDLQKDFINNMTHEFKTPLASILIASNYASAQNEIKENPKLAKYIQIIISQSNKLNQHIEKILTVAKTETKQILIQKKIIDVISAFELVKDNILLKYHNNIQINFESENKFQILADEFHFYNMVYNILDNAVKYSKSDAVIDVLIKENPKGLLLKFKDNGVGIPENDLPFVFDKFFRVAREDSKDIEGFGIGLSYVKRVCEWHKWKVFVTNNEDKGITVTVQLNKNDYE